MIPRFRRDGNLPAGIHLATWREFEERFGTNARRRALLSGLRRALVALQMAGCRTVYIDGSFVTAKELPNDFDGCWGVADVDPNVLDPVLLDFARSRAAQKSKYGGELFPAELPEGASGRVFLDFFQHDADGRPKGIVNIKLETLK
jgi:hypothetical protein